MRASSFSLSHPSVFSTLFHIELFFVADRCRLSSKSSGYSLFRLFCLFVCLVDCGDGFGLVFLSFIHFGLSSSRSFFSPVALSLTEHPVTTSCLCSF